MDIARGAAPLYRFAEFEFHARTGELHGSGRSVLLPDQACRVLLALLDSEGEVVSREALRGIIWPGRSYGDFEGGLNTAIFKLRQSLEDDGSEPRIIGTLPRRGYRLLVPVEKCGICGKEERGLDVGQQAGGAVALRTIPGERLPDSHSIWVATSPTGTDEPPGIQREEAAAGAPEPSPAARGRPARRRRKVGIIGASLLVLGAALAWGTAHRDLRQEVAWIVHRMTLPVQVLTGRVIRNPMGMEFVRIPAGTYTMGTDALPGQWLDMNFRPAHPVTLSRPFLLQATEVTVGQFKAFVEATNYRTDGERTDGIRVSKGLQPAAANQGYLFDRSMKRLDASWRNPYFPQEDDCPVVGVSWNDTQAFIDWLNEKDPGKDYRLPTEAEWEYACRAGDPGYVPRAAMGDIAWVGENSAFRTHPAARKEPNAFGLHDMLGNAWEWCQDWYVYGYSVKPDTDPPGPTWGTLKVIRGGGWRYPLTSDKVLLVTRSYAGLREGADDIGFRLAASAGGP